MVSPLPSPSPVTHTITQEQLARYADASGDHNPLHLDADFAAGTPYGRTIAHGMLVLAFISEMMTRAFGMAWLTGGRLKVRFRAPVFPGDVVTTGASLRAPVPGSGEATYDVACRNQSGQEVIIGEAGVRWPPG